MICAAGAWSQRIGEMAGVFLPVVPVRRQIGFTAALMRPMPTVPFTLDLGSTLYFHNAGDGLLLGISDAGQSPGFGREFSYEWVPAFDEAASVVAPSLAGVKMKGGLGRPLREHPRSQCLDRQSPGSQELPVRHGILRTRFSASPSRGRAGHRLVPGTRLVYGPAPIQGRPVP